jgi:hypothetical protein
LGFYLVKCLSPTSRPDPALLGTVEVLRHLEVFRQDNFLVSQVVKDIAEENAISVDEVLALKQTKNKVLDYT